MVGPMLESIGSPFRERYLSYAEMTAQLRAWADAFPDIVALDSIGRSREGRDLWMITIGRDPGRIRPAVWVDGNMHAQEVAGSSVALAIAEDAIQVHTGANLGLPAAVAHALREVVFHVLPRMSPDGAEAVLDTGRPVRSAPWLHRPNRQHPRWVAGDVDGDGRVRLMRVEDPAGEMVADPERPGLLLPRRLEDEGPFYKVYLEGTIENFDGHNVPSPAFLDDNDVDFNRNFPFGWAPPERQVGAGAFPLSEPETRAVVEATASRPNLFAWLNLHCFGGVFIRPLGDKPDSKMDPEDLALYRQLGVWAEELTDYPMVSGFEEFTYAPDTPIYGDLTEYAYHQRGCISYVVELWDIFARLGLPRPKRFVDYYSHIDREQLKALADWDHKANRGRIFGPWRRFDHPQLGAVELGGPDPRVGLWNPPFEELPDVCERHSRHFLRVAALAPRLAIREIERRRDGELTRLSVAVENLGYLPTSFLSSAKHLEISEPLDLVLEAEGCELLDPGRHAIGHLDGWGRGLYEAEINPYYLRTRGTTGRRVVTLAVKGQGRLVARAGSCRVGHIEASFEI